MGMRRRQYTAIWPNFDGTSELAEIRLREGVSPFGCRFVAYVLSARYFNDFSLISDFDKTSRRFLMIPKPSLYRRQVAAIWPGFGCICKIAEI